MKRNAHSRRRRPLSAIVTRPDFFIFSVATLLAATSWGAEPDDADPETIVRDEIVVSAHRAEVPRETVGSSVTVITAEEIERRAEPNVAELLRTVPGLEVVRGGGRGQVTSVFIRGGSSSQTLVLIDGIRLNSATTGAFDFADLSADGIERIEVLRGSQSTLYGSEAMGGVISIITRSGAEGRRLTALSEVGTEGLGRLRLGVEGGHGAFDYRFSASREERDGISAASEAAGNREDDPYENTTLAGRLGFGFAGDGRFDVTLRRFEGDVGNDGFLFPDGPVDDLDRTQQREGLVAGVSVSKSLGSRVRSSLALNVHDEELSGRDPSDQFSNFRIDSRIRELTARAEVSLGAADVLTFGYSDEEREGGSVGSFEEEIDIRSFFVENRWENGERFFLTAAVRNDDHSQFGDETTWRVTSTLRWPVSGARLHGSYGTGFKAPTLNDLYFPFFSNPDLRPETSEGFDLGIEKAWGGDRWLVDLTVFDTDFEDLIAFDFVTFTPQNIAAASSTGAEISVRFAPSERWQWSGSHTWNETEDLASGAQLARRPEHRTALSLFFEPSEAWRGTASVIAVRDRIDSDGSDLDDYERLDLVLEYMRMRSLKPYLRLENLLDETYEEVNGFTSPGIQAAVGLRFAG